MALNSNLHFPARLFQIIENEDNSIIRWEPDGKSFRIANHQRFEQEILPKYFRHSRVASIQRQLNLYGFRCAHRGEEKGVFFHPQFQRGHYDEASNIRRMKSTQSHGDISQRSPRAFVDSSLARHSNYISIDDNDSKISTCLTLLGKRFYDELLNQEHPEQAHHQSTTVVTDSTESAPSGDEGGGDSRQAKLAVLEKKVVRSADLQRNKRMNAHKVANAGQNSRSVSGASEKAAPLPSREFNCIDYVDDNWVKLRDEMR